MSALAWEQSEAAMQLLCELDAVERQSDFCIGQGWDQAAQGHRDRAEEIDWALETLRSDAVDAFVAATGHPKESDPWWEALEEAESEATTVKEAADFARREHWGDRLLERAA